VSDAVSVSGGFITELVAVVVVIVIIVVVVIVDSVEVQVQVQVIHCAGVLAVSGSMSATVSVSTPVTTTIPIRRAGSVGFGGGCGVSLGATVAVATTALRWLAGSHSVGAIGTIIVARGTARTEILADPGLILRFIDHGSATRLARLVGEAGVGPSCARDTAP